MSTNHPKIKVVIRYLAIFEKWFICHEKTYQNAFRPDYNGFETREKAVKFAQENGTEVVFHEHDRLQKHQSETATSSAP